MRVTRHPYEVAGWGVGELWVGDGELVLAHDAPTAAPALATSPATPLVTPPRGAGNPPTGTLATAPARESDGFAAELLQSIHRYFAGEPVSFADVPLDEDWPTPFAAALARALRAVPWGEVVSYGELSARAGRERAARAAGSFCATNRFALFVPCHRVVAAGGLGGYGSLGVAYKRRLLELEGWRPGAALR